jgi:DNA-binding beta-propeller fold protein YncE
MKKLVLSASFFISLLFSVIVAFPAYSGVLYATDDSTSSFYSINTTTGTATLIGPCGMSLSLTGLAYDTLNMKMYVSDVFGPNGYGLGTIDISTGAVTYIGGHITSSNIHGLAYDSLYDVLYGADTDNGNGLSIINRATGASTFVGLWSAAAALQIRGLAYAPATDTLYGIDPTNIYTINRATGAATAVGPHGIASGSYIGLELDSDTEILYSASDLTGNLYSINKATGAATLIGPTGIQVSGLAAVPGKAFNAVGAPTLGIWAMIALVLCLFAAGYWKMRRAKAI